MLFLLQILSLLYHIAMTTIQPSLEPAITNPSQPHLPHFQHTNAPSAPNPIPTIPYSNDYNTTITRTGHHVHTFCRYLVFQALSIFGRAEAYAGEVSHPNLWLYPNFIELQTLLFKLLMSTSWLADARWVTAHEPLGIIFFTPMCAAFFFSLSEISWF